MIVGRSIVARGGTSGLVVHYADGDNWNAYVARLNSNWMILGCHVKSRE